MYLIGSVSSLVFGQSASIILGLPLCTKKRQNTQLVRVRFKKGGIDKPPNRLFAALFAFQCRARLSSRHRRCRKYSEAPLCEFGLFLVPLSCYFFACFFSYFPSEISVVSFHPSFLNHKSNHFDEECVTLSIQNCP